MNDRPLEAKYRDDERSGDHPDVHVEPDWLPVNENKGDVALGTSLLHKAL